MDVNDLLSRAWSAVEESGVPESLYPVAFKEAIDHLRGEDDERGSRSESKRGTRSESKRGRSRKKKETETSQDAPDEDTFFADLASESGETEQDLKDVLRLTNEGKVQIIPPTKDLGDSVAEQARNAIALVAGARARGLQETPVNADAVRDELKRKHCWNGGNFAATHLGPMKGFNAGSDRKEIVLSSKWVDDFCASIAKLHGRGSDGSDD